MGQYLGFERVASDATVKNAADDLTIPDNTTFAEVQADTNTVRYTLDGATDPTSSAGMQFLVTAEPKMIRIEDLLNIRFTQDDDGAGGLNFHYAAGRNI